MASKDGKGLSDVFRGLTDMLERIADLADANDVGEFEALGGKLKGVWGFKVTTGGSQGSSEPAVTVQPFGNVQTATTGDVVVTPVREPLLDILDEGDHVLVVAEMPGIGLGDVEWALDGDILRLEAKSGAIHYRTERLLPRDVEGQSVEVKGANGIIELRIGETSP